MIRRGLTQILLACLLVLTSCARSSEETAVPPQLAELRRAFGEAGVEVITEQPAATGLFGGPMDEYLWSVNRRSLHLFVFPSSRETSAAAATVSPDGSSTSVERGGSTIVTNFNWIGRPHFFWRDNVMALYLSGALWKSATDRRMLALLRDYFGPQSAGLP